MIRSDQISILVIDNVDSSPSPSMISSWSSSPDRYKCLAWHTARYLHSLPGRSGWGKGWSGISPGGWFFLLSGLGLLFFHDGWSCSSFLFESERKPSSQDSIGYLLYCGKHWDHLGGKNQKNIWTAGGIFFKKHWDHLGGKIKKHWDHLGGK